MVGEKPVKAIFIRAPAITQVGERVRVLASLPSASGRLESDPATADAPAVLVQQDNLLGCCFHPELSDDLRIHDYFVSMCRDHLSKSLAVAECE